MTDYGLAFSHFAVAGEGWLPLVSFGNLAGLLAVCNSPSQIQPSGQTTSATAMGAADHGSHPDGLAVRAGVVPAH